jgi:Kef-type K+ transport system membrane component KefB
MNMDVLLPDALTRTIAQIVVIVAAARLVGFLMRRLRQPMVIAEIVAGILLGPSLMGWLLPDVSAALFPPESLGILQIMSQLGLLLFMFMVGMDLDLRALRTLGPKTVIISHCSIVVPFALGMLVAVYLHPRFSSAAVSFLPFALFMGAAMSITAFPVLARILTERGLVRTRVGAVSIACAAVDDVTAWCILAFIVTAVRADGIWPGLRTTALALLYVGVMWAFLRPLLMRLAARIGLGGSQSQNVVAAVLVLLFLSSWVTEVIGIHALFGSFLFGVILPKTGDFGRILADRIEPLVLVVLLPLFFAYSGLRTQIGLLTSVSDWAACGLILAVACIGKFGGSVLPARWSGLSWREAGAVGVLMNTRGLMELIVLNIGLDLGVISPAIFTMMVIMALLTTFITTPILQWVYRPGEIEEELRVREKALW